MCDPTELTFGCFNLLADGLSGGEFLCEGGDLTTEWTNRRNILCSVLQAMLKECAVVVTVENDHFYQLLNDVRKQESLVSGLWGTDINRLSTARKLKLTDQSRRAGIDIRQGSDVYQSLNAALHRGDVNSTVGTSSYTDECGRYAAVMAGLQGNTPEDLFQSNDGIGVYYRSDLLDLVEVGVPGNEACHVVDGDDTKIVTNMNFAVRATFRVKGGGSPGKELTVYGAHLKSGEGYDQEKVRCDQLKGILEDARHRPNPVVLMDGNNSVHYEAKYHQEQANSREVVGTRHSTDTTTIGKDIETLSSVMAQYGMVDAIGPPYQVMGNECFKMRHGRGGQPSKHFQLMFDAIDKILVPRTATILPTDYERCRFGFERYDPTHHSSLYALRTSDTARRELEHHCRSTTRIAEATCAVEAFGADHMLAGLYPNPRAPSDHPPVACRVVF